MSSLRREMPSNADALREFELVRAKFGIAQQFHEDFEDIVEIRLQARPA